MATRKDNTPIPPFPADIDRDGFARTITGITIGEGCFTLSYTHATTRNTYQHSARFEIGLRYDDRPILELVQSYFGCGTLTRHNRTEPTFNDMCRYRVLNISEIRNVIIPHFENFHMYTAKKQRDFLVFREAIELLYNIDRKKFKSRGHHKGSFPKWTQKEHDQFMELYNQIKNVRKYEENSIQQIDLPPRIEEPTPWLPGLSSDDHP